MPNFPTTSYSWVAYDLKELSEDLDRLALDTSENITQVEAALCHHHLGKVLKSLILATRIGRAEWSSLSQQMQSLTT